MKQIASFIIMLCLLSCQSAEKQTTGTTENTVLVIITDNSLSYASRCPKITGQILKQVCDKIIQTSNIDIRVGLVTADSNIEFARFTQSKSVSQSNPNPWIESGREKPTTEPQNDWQIFSNALAENAKQKPSKGSDIGGALSHALLIFQEYPAKCRKILVIATDYENNGMSIPPIDSTIEVISIGKLPNIPIEKTLQTQNIKRVESLATALQFISSTY